jgi:chromosome segregation ATPase
MNQPSVAQADQLTRRSKELDAREAYITTREQLLDAVDPTIQQDLDTLEKTIATRERYNTELLANRDKLEKEYATRQKQLQGTIAVLEKSVVNWQSKVTAKQSELTEVNRQIAERTKYQKDLEIAITEQAEAGNLKLRGMQYEVIEAKQVIRDLEVKKKSLKAGISELEEDLENARVSFLPELAEHERQVEITKGQITDTTTELAGIRKEVITQERQLDTLHNKAKQIHVETDAKLATLAAKERQVMAKREALRQEREEMEEDRHHFSSAKRLYELE